jgi:hypothetical protein
VKYYFVHTDREHYRVSLNGFITRHCLGWQCSPQWRLRGLVRYNNFGYRVEFVPFPQCMKITDMRYKNGKAKWRVADYDHGTNREWGEPLRVVGEATCTNPAEVPS